MFGLLDIFAGRLAKVGLQTHDGQYDEAAPGSTQARVAVSGTALCVSGG